MKAPLIKDKIYRKNFLKQEEKQRVLKTLKMSSKLYTAWWSRHKLSSFCPQIHNNRCVITQRSGSTNRRFKLSRLEFRRWATCHNLPGVEKGSW